MFFCPTFFFFFLFFLFSLSALFYRADRVVITSCWLECVRIQSPTLVTLPPRTLPTLDIMVRTTQYVRTGGRQLQSGLAGLVECGTLSEYRHVLGVCGPRVGIASFNVVSLIVTCR